MDISREEQRLLHRLALGGHIEALREGKRLTGLRAYTRDGWLMPAPDAPLFRKLKRRRAIASQDGGPYRITRRGLELVRAQVDNRG